MVSVALWLTAGGYAELCSGSGFADAVDGHKTAVSSHCEGQSCRFLVPRGVGGAHPPSFALKGMAVRFGIEWHAETVR